MPQVKIGPHHFAGEVRVYRDRYLAYWREQLQNAVDSGASQINITVGEKQTDEKAQEYQTTIIEDNGCGMSRETLETVYFVLGESTKRDNSTVGGYGKARILTSFSQRNYQLWTNNLHVTGCGADYEIAEVDTRYKGVKIQVDVFTPHAVDLKAVLYDYLRRCYIRARVFVNGERFTEWTYARYQARELSFGTIHTNKQKQSELLIRVDGTLMFTRSTSVGQQVILEIHQNKSREVLQANRDGMLMESQNELDAFINELNINKRSALKKKRSKSTFFEGTGTFKTRRKKAVKEITVDSLSVAIHAYNEAARNTGEALITESMSPYAIVEKLTEAGLLNEPSRVIQPAPAAYDTGLLNEREYVDSRLNLFNVVIEDETENPLIRKRIETYDPRNWDLDATPVRGNIRGEYRRGIGYLKLLLVWKACCEIALEKLIELHPGIGEEVSWGVGWIFSDSAEAQHQSRGDTHYILLNPCTKDGTLAWSLSDNASIAKLLGISCHEIAHCLINQHDEDFANVLTDLIGPIFDGKTEIMRKLKESKSEAVVKSLFGDAVPAW